MTRRILIVDDEMPIQDFLARALATEGYAISRATDGAAALEVVKREPPDLILLDMWLPNVNGEAFIRQYVASTKRPVPIVVMTADHLTYSSPEVAAAVKGVLIKPFGLDELFDCINKHFPRETAGV
ncbi:MAG: response regulator [Anaerolineae bacterium]|nr:response regulator [Anaerolineae bacterium]